MVQFRALPPGSTAASVADCTIPLFLNVPPLAARSLSHPQPAVARGGTMGKKWWPNGAWDMHPGFFYMPQICDNFTSLPKEGVLRIFYRPLKIQRLRSGLNPRTYVSEHRSCYVNIKIIGKSHKLHGTQ